MARFIVCILFIIITYWLGWACIYRYISNYCLMWLGSLNRPFKYVCGAQGVRILVRLLCSSIKFNDAWQICLIDYPLEELLTCGMWTAQMPQRPIIVTHGIGELCGYVSIMVKSSSHVLVTVFVLSEWLWELTWTAGDNELMEDYMFISVSSIVTSRGRPCAMSWVNTYLSSLYVSLEDDERAL